MGVKWLKYGIFSQDMHPTMFKLHVAYIVELLWCEIRHGNKWQVHVLGILFKKWLQYMARASCRKNFALCDMDTFVKIVSLWQKFIFIWHYAKSVLLFFGEVWLYDTVIFFSQCVSLGMSTKWGKVRFWICEKLLFKVSIWGTDHLPLP